MRGSCSVIYKLSVRFLKTFNRPGMFSETEQ